MKLLYVEPIHPIDWDKFYALCRKWEWTSECVCICPTYNQIVDAFLEPCWDCVKEARSAERGRNENI